MKIYIENLKFKCIIGILDFEREKEQDVELNIVIKYNYKKNDFINYALVSSLVKKIMIDEKFLLLEDALKKISFRLKEDFHSIKKLYIKISKPTILKDCKVSVSKKYKYNS